MSSSTDIEKGPPSSSVQVETVDNSVASQRPPPLFSISATKTLPPQTESVQDAVVDRSAALERDYWSLVEARLKGDTSFTSVNALLWYRVFEARLALGCEQMLLPSSENPENRRSPVHLAAIDAAIGRLCKSLSSSPNLKEALYSGS
jgi:hypothetical protein